MTAPDRLSTAPADRYRIERELGQGGMAAVECWLPMQQAKANR